MMDAAALLDRIATSLRTRIGPTVGDDYAKTQTYMAGVILQKLAGELRAADQAATTAAELDTLLDDLRAEDAAAPLPAAVVHARDALAAHRDDAALAALVTALYGAATALGPARFDHLLGRVRTCLRARLQRVLEYAA